MKRIKDWNLTGMLQLVALLSISGAALLAFGFRYESPAEALNSHIVNFEIHVENFEDFLDLESDRQSDHDQRTVMVEAQTRLACLRTGQDTLIMLGMVQVCDSLGVRR